MHYECRSPEGIVYKCRDIRWFLMWSLMSSVSNGFSLLMYAVIVSIETPALLEDENNLMIAISKYIKATDEAVRWRGYYPKKIKKVIYAALFREWASYLGKDAKRCPPCPIPVTVWISRVIKAISADLEEREQYEMLWAEYIEPNSRMKKI